MQTRNLCSENLLSGPASAQFIWGNRDPSEEVTSWVQQKAESLVFAQQQQGPLSEGKHTSHPLGAGLGRGLAVTAEECRVAPATRPPFTWREMSLRRVLSHRRAWRESLHHRCLLSPVGPTRGASDPQGPK